MITFDQALLFQNMYLLGNDGSKPWVMISTNITEKN